MKRNTQIMLGVFAALLVVVILYQRSTADDVPAEEEFPTPLPSAALFEFTIEEVTGLSVKNLDGRSAVLEKQGETWVSITPASTAEETDSLRINNIITQLVTIRVVNIAPLDAPLQVLGLDFPPFTITLTLSSGVVVEIRIGAPSVTNTGYYVSVDSGLPQLVTKSSIDQAIGLLDTPPLLPTPIIVPTEVISGTVLITDTQIISPTTTQQP